MTQVLEMAAPPFGIGLCQMGTLNPALLSGPLAFEPGHVFLHSLVGGFIADPGRGGRCSIRERLDRGRDLNAVELLRSLREEGVHLWCEGDKLRYRAPKGLAPGVVEALGACKAQVLELLQRPPAAGPCFQAWNPQARPRTYPLSFAQQRMWFLRQLEPESCALNVPFGLRISGKLDVTALQGSLNDLVARHEALRTTCAMKDGVPVQMIAPPKEDRVAGGVRSANDYGVRARDRIAETGPG